MVNNRKLILDTHCEIYDMIKHHADGIFWNLEQHVKNNEVVAGAVYVIGREQAKLNPSLVKELIATKDILMVYSNPNEGSEPMEWQMNQSDFGELLTQGRMIAVTGGDVNPAYPQILYENFLGKVHDYKENLQAIEEYASEERFIRPYKFLFLNGRMRPHRKYLLIKFQEMGLLDQALWSNLDSSLGVGSMCLIENNSLNHYFNTTLPVRYLPAEYEVPKYQAKTATPPDLVDGRLEGKFNLFDHEWGEIYLNTRAYLDTYFSLVTETVFDHPYSFRTEKIWKPIAIGHPFVAVTGRGYYRDLHRLGFRTFGHLIDESFDTIDNNQERIDRIVDMVNDLCQQDLPAFVTAAKEVCKYNQQLMVELRPKTRSEFPERFFQFIKNY